MTPSVAKRGGSFKGAAAYYLHDKDADTSRRVAFAVTRNLPTEEPELAWRWMAYTAKHTGVLKHEAGVARSGPKMCKPVYALSLSWHPDDKPTPDLMVAMMDAALEKIGLARCQSLYIAHNDTEHPHIHALVNLVDPENGKILDPGRDKIKLSRWAQRYETERGVIRCQRRVENNARRDRGEWVVDRHSKTRQDIEQEKLIERRALAGRPKSPQDRQGADWEALKARIRQEATAISARINEKFRPEWAQLYQRMRQDEQAFGRARRQQLASMRMLQRAPRMMGVERRDWIATILVSMNKARAAAETQRAVHEREIRRLARRMEAERAAAVAAAWADLGRKHRALGKLHAEARQTPPTLAAPDAQKAQGTRTAPTARPGPRGTNAYDALKPARKQPAPGARPRPRRSDTYEALKSATPPTPTREEEDRRREALKAEFRRQAEEIARRRRERKHKDRDRDRER